MVTKLKKRSLYQCAHARCRLDRIVCSKGHALSTLANGTISLIRLKRGAPLEYSVCQDCRDFKSMGGPLNKKGRGWA